MIKYMSSYSPTKTLDQIYKIFVRPHMDDCDIIYHLPRSTSAFDCPINLNFMMQSLQSTQYQAALAVSGAWKGSAQLSCMKSLGGSPYLTEDGSEDFVNFTRFKMNSLHHI